MKLITTPNFDDPDGIYACIIALHESYNEEVWPEVCARLVLILANHIGDEEVLQEALELAGKRRIAA